MVDERRVSETRSFDAATQLAKRIEELTKERDELSKQRQDSQIKLLEEHGKSLASVKTTLALLVEQTKNLPDLDRRVKRLEAWKAYLAGIASAFTLIGTLIGAAITSLIHK
jgi:DNA repair exonuclease SbcCD ATPase subunit